MELVRPAALNIDDFSNYTGAPDSNRKSVLRVARGLAIRSLFTLSHAFTPL